MSIAGIAARPWGRFVLGRPVLFKALSDPHRLAIVAMLSAAADEVCVCNFTSELLRFIKTRRTLTICGSCGKRAS